MIYLASPYYHPDALVMKTRFLLAKQVTQSLIERELWTYSPILHNHPLELDRPHDFWMRYDLEMLRRCDLLTVLAIPGWQQSRGVTIEIDTWQQIAYDRCITFVDHEGNFIERSEALKIGPHN
jgi:hypothetical protein